MAYLDINHVKLQGVTVCIPKNTVENMDYEVVPADQRQIFVETIGIERRRVADADVCTSDLCQRAAEHLLEQIGWERNTIDCLIFISQTPDYKMPATSCVLQEKLGLNKHLMSLDISQGCSGYVYGLGVAGSLMSTGTLKRCLLLVGNTQSKNLNPKDKSVWPLFSDAGSATAIEYTTENGDSLKLSYGTDGSGEQTIIIPDGGYRNMVTPESFKEEEFEGGIIRNRLNLIMHGDDVFGFVISNIPKFTKDLFDHFNIDESKIDYYLLHHASKFVCQKLIKKLKIADAQKAPLVLKDYGNISNVSIPLLLTYIADEIKNKRLNLFISGFGVGLSLGVGVINVGNFKCSDLIEY